MCENSEKKSLKKNIICKVVSNNGFSFKINNINH